MANEQCGMAVVPPQAIHLRTSLEWRTSPVFSKTTSNLSGSSCFASSTCIAAGVDVKATLTPP
jgi:hypothetical protein